MSVGVTKDYKLKVRNLHASHTLFRLRTNCENKIFRHILVPGNANHDSHRFLGADK
jgi:hypothetical protein